MYLYIHASTRYHAIKALKHMVAPETVDNLHSTSRALSSSAMPSAFKSVRYVSVNRPLLLFFVFFFCDTSPLEFVLHDNGPFETYAHVSHANLNRPLSPYKQVSSDTMHTSGMLVLVGLFCHTNRPLLPYTRSLLALAHTLISDL